MNAFLTHVSTNRERKNSCRRENLIQYHTIKEYPASPGQCGSAD